MSDPLSRLKAQLKAAEERKGGAGGSSPAMRQAPPSVLHRPDIEDDGERKHKSTAAAAAAAAAPAAVHVGGPHRVHSKMTATLSQAEERHVAILMEAYIALIPFYREAGFAWHTLA